MAQLIIVCLEDSAEGAPRAWQRFEYVVAALSLTLSASFCLSLFVPATVHAVVLQIQFIFDEALRFWAAVVIPAGNIRRPSLAHSLCVSPGVDTRTHTHTERPIRNRRRRNKTKPSTQSEIVPPFSVWVSIYFPLCPLWSTTCICMRVYLCVCVRVCVRDLWADLRVLSVGGFTLLLPFQSECHALKKKT